MTDRKKPGVAFWATVGLVGLVVFFHLFGAYRLWPVACNYFFKGPLD